MFSPDAKRLSFRCQTLKFSRPNVTFYFSTLLKGKMFVIENKGSFCLAQNTPEEEEERLRMAR